MAQGRVFQIEKRFNASPDEIWQAWTTREGICGWFLDDLHGSVAEGETISWEWNECEAREDLLVRGLNVGRRLELAPSGDGWPDGFIEITIEPSAGGETILRLVQSGFRDDVAWDEEYEGVRSGWTMALAILDEYLTRHAGSKRASIPLTRRLLYADGALAPFYRDSESLKRWLTRSGTIGDEGDQCNLTLQDNTTLTGRVIARTDTEVALTWDEIDGVLELKAYGVADSRVVCLVASSWKDDNTLLESKGRLLDGALDALVDCLTKVDSAV